MWKRIWKPDRQKEEKASGRIQDSDEESKKKSKQNEEDDGLVANW